MPCSPAGLGSVATILTISVELDDVRNGKQLWGEQYNRKPADLLAVKNEIAQEVSQRLRSQLSADDRQKLTKGSTDNPGGLPTLSQGQVPHEQRLTKDGFRKGLDYFNQAIAVNPNYGLAYSGMAYNYMKSGRLVHASQRGGAQGKVRGRKGLGD